MSQWITPKGSRFDNRSQVDNAIRATEGWLERAPTKSPWQRQQIAVMMQQLDDLKAAREQ
jgi:hypothetical protein